MVRLGIEVGFGKVTLIWFRLEVDSRKVRMDWIN